MAPVKSMEKNSSFAMACSLFSRYVKQNGAAVGELGLGIRVQKVMAPGRRGRPSALPIEFIREQGWEDYAEGRSIGNRKDKYFKHPGTGKICRSTAGVKRILDAKGIFYSKPLAKAKISGPRLTIGEPKVTSPVNQDLRGGALEVDAVRHAEDDNVGNFPRNPIADGNYMAPARAVKIVCRQDEAVVEPYQHGQVKNFDLNIELNSDGEEKEGNPGVGQD